MDVRNLIVIAGCAVLVGCATQKTPVDMSQMVQMTAAPQVTHRVSPEYPAEVRQRGLEGTVKLRVLVDVDGSVKDVEALEYAHVELVEPAVTAMKQWTFEPAQTASGPQAMWVVVPMDFELSN